MNLRNTFPVNFKWPLPLEVYQKTNNPKQDTPCFRKMRYKFCPGHAVLNKGTKIKERRNPNSALTLAENSIPHHAY
jgi:hypothetical protein